MIKTSEIRDDLRAPEAGTEVVGTDEMESMPFRYSITSYGADFPVDALVKRMNNESILIPPFQRGYVWSHREASRFIESLLLGLPIPSIFLSKEQDSQKLLVIDGQHRLLTIKYFYDGIWPPTRKEFALKGVQPQFEGFTYKTLSDEDRRRLDDSLLHAIIVKQDEPSEDESSIYHIFERLNAGGVLLTPQEIRTAIHHGELSDLLRELNKNESWRKIYGPVSKNMRDQELILRFIALYFDAAQYARPMKEFLTKYMGRNKHLAVTTRKLIASTFNNTIETVFKSLGEKAFKPARALNAAVFDAVMVGVARRLQKGLVRKPEQLRRKYEELLKSPAFMAVSERATADEESVSTRLRLATQAFDQVQ